MLRKSFYRKLRRVADQFLWLVKKDGCIRAYKGSREYCPITATFCAYKGSYIPCSNYDDAADEMDINSNVASCIAEAADFYENELDYKLRFIRRSLLRAVGLIGVNKWVN